MCFFLLFPGFISSAVPARSGADAAFVSAVVRISGDAARRTDAGADGIALLDSPPPFPTALGIVIDAATRPAGPALAEAGGAVARMTLAGLGEAAAVLMTGVLVTSAWAAIDVWPPFDADCPASATTTAAPALAPIAVATMTMRTVSMNLGAGAR
jgi:hypothetical protein